MPSTALSQSYLPGCGERLGPVSRLHPFHAHWPVAPSNTGPPTDGRRMNNTGGGLVVASVALADHPQAMLPIIFYNLAQNLVASVVYRHIASARDA